MKISDIVEAKSIRYLYHVTLISNLPQIARDGLTPNTDRDPNFDGYPVQGKLFVTDAEGAEFYAEQLSAFDETVILRFPAALVKVRRDEWGNLRDRFTRSAVPANFIEMFQNNTWQPLQKSGEVNPGYVPKQAPWQDDSLD